MDNQFHVGYNGWVAITIPDKINYVNKNESPGSENFDDIPYIGNDDDLGDDIEIVMFQVNSASVTRSVNVPTINAYYLPFQTDDEDKMKEVKSSIRCGYGTVSFSGNIDFDMTYGALKLLTADKNKTYGSMFQRSSLFHVQFFDGMHTCTLYNCVWNSFSISCQANSLITGSLAFQSNNGYCENLMITKNKDVTEEAGNGTSSSQMLDFDQNDLLIPYWQTAMDKGYDSVLTQFSIGFDKNVQPVFLNNIWRTPSYLKPGLITVNLNATYVDYYDPSNQSTSSSSSQNNIIINIGNEEEKGKKITLNSAVLMNQAYNMSNMNDVGQKTYTWNAINLDNTKNLFSIEDL